jgi:hypothetical protein
LEDKDHKDHKELEVYKDHRALLVIMDQMVPKAYKDLRV